MITLWISFCSLLVDCTVIVSHTYRLIDIESCIYIMNIIIILPSDFITHFSFLYLCICLCLLCIVVCMYSYNSAHIFIVCNVYVIYNQSFN